MPERTRAGTAHETLHGVGPQRHLDPVVHDRQALHQRIDHLPLAAILVEAREMPAVGAVGHIGRQGRDRQELPTAVRDSFSQRHRQARTDRVRRAGPQQARRPPGVDRQAPHESFDQGGHALDDAIGQGGRSDGGGLPWPLEVTGGAAAQEQVNRPSHLHGQHRGGDIHERPHERNGAHGPRQRMGQLPGGRDDHGGGHAEQDQRSELEDKRRPHHLATGGDVPHPHAVGRHQQRAHEQARQFEHDVGGKGRQLHSGSQLTPHCNEGSIFVVLPKSIFYNRLSLTNFL